MPPSSRGGISFAGPHVEETDTARAASPPLFMRELGWIEGRNVVIEYQWAEGSIDRSAGIVAESIRLKLDAIILQALMT